MSYSLNRFLRPLKETDKTIRIFDDRNFPVHTVNPFSVLRVFVNNSNLNISLSGNRTIVLDFDSQVDTIEALSKFQSIVDQLRQKAPVIIDKETEKYVEKIIQTSVGIGSLNGVTASKQTLEFFGDDNLDISIESDGGTHSITLNWSGILPIERGGLNNTEFNEGEILISNSESVISSGYKLNNDGISEFDIWSASRILKKLSDNKVVFNIGDGQKDTFDLIHNLGTRAVIVQIFDVQTGESVETEVIRKDENSVEVSFNKPPDSEKYCVVIS
jgi:hypothetical protein